jgi:hypothetical protein
VGAANAPGAAGASVDATPIPSRAAQQYAQALELMKSGRNTDAELEFKQLAAGYPQFAGPQLNLGLLSPPRGGSGIQNGAGAQTVQRNRWE